MCVCAAPRGMRVRGAGGKGGRRRRTCRPNVSCLIVEGGGGRLRDLLSANFAFQPCKYFISLDEFSKLPSSTTLFAMLATKTALWLPIDRGRKSRRGSFCSHHYEAQYALPAAARARRDGRGGGGGGVGPGLTLRQRAASTMQECNINFE